MTILVLGATGNTGSEVVKQLKTKKLDFKVMVRASKRAKPLELSDEQITLGDFTDVKALTAAMTGVRSVYLAMNAHPDNELWVNNVITAAKKAGVVHIVKLSGMGANESAGSLIIRTHAKTDEQLKASGLKYTLVQPNSFYQNLFGSLETIKNLGQFFLPMADAKQSVVDIRDVAAVAVEALATDQHFDKTYLLSGPEGLNFKQQAEILSKAANKDIHYIAVKKEDAEQAMKAAGMSDWLAEHLAEILDWFSQGGYDYTTKDVEQVLGRPACTFEDFAKEFSELI